MADIESIISDLLKPYNPWLELGASAFEQLPAFHRPIFHQVLGDLVSLPQMISITGPRRVGKSTVLKQLIRHCLLKEGYAPDHLVYYQFDDPALFRPRFPHDRFVDTLMHDLDKRSKDRPVILFLDEIQRLDRWELFLKKYYDLSYKVRLVISGSASSPIFKKSRESLLGRVKDYHLLPFSFREFLLYRLQGDERLTVELDSIHRSGEQIMGMLSGDPKHSGLQSVEIPALSPELKVEAEKHFTGYLDEGGFPECWSMPSWEQKIDYLYDNQVKKVIYEDLVLATEFRKPELLKQFYISLLERPGREINLSKVADETKINLAQVEKYLPLLEMTDLVARVEKFRKSALKVRRGNIKVYLVDLALRNAVLRLQGGIQKDPAVMGLYAENLVFNALKKWKGKLALDYYRQKDEEIDFVVHLQPGSYLPIEVKYREVIPDTELKAIRGFARRNATWGIVVTKDQRGSGVDGLGRIPLLEFLLAFD